jgi:hypothetical protein
MAENIIKQDNNIKQDEINIEVSTLKRSADTPSLTSALVDSATKLSFRKVSEEVEKYTAGVISASTVHCLLTRVTQDAICSNMNHGMKMFG